jgi:hypothetical protein
MDEQFNVDYSLLPSPIYPPEAHPERRMLWVSCSESPKTHGY